MLVLWSMVQISQGEVTFLDASPYVGMDNLEFRPRIMEDLGVREGASLAMASITSGFFSFHSRFVSVMKSPGQMAFTVIPWGAQSAPAQRVKWIMAALVVS